MPWHPVASGMCDRNVNAADGVGSWKHEPRTHPAHADGRLVYNGADRDGQNGNPSLMRPGQAKEIKMADSTKDKIEGTVHDVKGAVKEKIGRATNDPDLEDEGTAEKVGGKVQKKVGDVEKALGD
jgi:uncharacterized protein YjbJ (UPF0337 family)